jgi:phosphoesterase RecJ-like protein
VPVGREIAEPAFVALTTDTGWFRFSSTTAGTLRLAARLVEAGATPDRLYKELYENNSHARLQLIGRALVHAQTELDGRLIYTWLDHADFDATGALPSDSEDIINETLAVGPRAVSRSVFAAVVRSIAAKSLSDSAAADIRKPPEHS